MNWLSRILPGRDPGTDLAPEHRARLASWQALPEPDLHCAHFETRYVVFNTEATGLRLDEDRLLSIGAIALEDAAIRPQASYYAVLEPDPAQALAGLLSFAGKSPLVVFNTAFNAGMLERALAQHLGLEIEQPVIDLSMLLPALCPETGLDFARLADWLRMFEIETFQRHHALGDGYAIAQLLQLALARATAQGHTSVRSLFELERSRRRLLRLP